MKKNTFILCFMFLFDSFAQQTITEKYWNYRTDFNDNFILRGFGNSFIGGYSLPVSQIKTIAHGTKEYITGYGEIDMAKFPNIRFGDCTILLGLYLGTLITEWKLLKNANENVSDLEQEIFEALSALDRLDANSEVFLGDDFIEQRNYKVKDGMMLRDDVTREFLGRFFDEKRIAQRYYPQMKSIESINILRSIFIKNSKSDCINDGSKKDFITDWYLKGGGNILSPDQITYLLVGLTLFAKYAPVQMGAKNESNIYISFEPQQWAKETITRILKRAHNFDWRLYTYYKYPAGLEPDISLHQYPLTKIHDNFGNNRVSIPNDINFTSSAFYSNFISTLTKPDRVCDYSRSDQSKYGPYIINAFGFKQNSGNDFAAGYAGILSAMSNYKGGTTTYDELVSYFGSFESYLQPLLNATLYEFNSENINPYIYKQLQDAPCDGMQCREKHNEDRGTYLWNADEKHNKFIRNFYDANVNKNKEHLNGLEYMLLHNLYLIKTAGKMTKLQTKIANSNSIKIVGQDILVGNTKLLTPDLFKYIPKIFRKIKYVAGDMVILAEGFDSNNLPFEAYTEQSANENTCVEPVKFGAYCPDANVKSQAYLTEPSFEIKTYGEGLIKYYTGSIGASPARKFEFVSNQVNSATDGETFVENPEWIIYPHPNGRDSHWSITTGKTMNLVAKSDWQWGNLKEEEEFYYRLDVKFKYYGQYKVISKNIRMKHFRCFVSCARLAEDSLNLEKSNNFSSILSLKIAPNPMQHSATIYYDIPQYSNAVNIQIFDAMGSLAKSVINTQNEEAGNYQYTIPESELSPGLYIVKLTTDIGSKSVKLVVQ